MNSIFKIKMAFIGILIATFQTAHSKVLVSDKETISKINEIETLSQQKNFIEAYIESAQLMNELYGKARVNEIVYEINPTFTTVFNEVKTEKHSSSMSFSLPLFSFIPFLGSLTGGGSETYDVTKIIMQNPRETAI